MNDASSQWQSVYPKEGEGAFLPYEAIRGRDCQITLERRPYYCDRGNYIAKLFTDTGSKLALSIDGADMWPRYYFDYQHAKAEIEAWLTKRGQWLAGAATPPEAPALSILAFVINNNTIVTLPEVYDETAFASLSRQVVEGDLMTKALRLGASAALIRFQAVETLQRLQADAAEKSSHD